jgi:hypothetical protein
MLLLSLEGKVLEIRCSLNELNEEEIERYLEEGINQMVDIRPLFIKLNQELCGEQNQNWQLQ